MIEHQIILTVHAPPEIHPKAISRVIDKLVHAGMEKVQSAQDDWTDANLAEVAKLAAIKIHDSSIAQHPGSNVTCASSAEGVWCTSCPCPDMSFLTALATVIECARSHIEDIESGLAEGIYDPEENQDLQDKQSALAIAEAWRQQAFTSQ